MELLPDTKASLMNLTSFSRTMHTLARHARQLTAELLRRETPEFTAAAHSPHLNPVDYRRMSVPHSITGRGRSAAEVDECTKQSTSGERDSMTQFVHREIL